MSTEGCRKKTFKAAEGGACNPRSRTKGAERRLKGKEVRRGAHEGDRDGARAIQ